VDGPFIGQIGAGPGAVGNVGGFPVGGAGLAVGFEPVIEILPEGSTLTAAAVVSADLRYVRLAAIPSFTAISEVFTFTFVGSNAGQTMKVP
jgi:hypothetical protein